MKIPKHALIIDSVSGSLKDGKEVCLRVFDGSVSLGSASGFLPTGAIWVEIWYPGEKFYKVKRYTGRNIPIAKREIDKVRAALA